MSKLIRFMSGFFASLKAHGARSVGAQTSVAFEYLTGGVPLSQLDSSLELMMSLWYDVNLFTIT